MDLRNALVAVLNFVVVAALSYGPQVALGALGVTLIHAILCFSTFAHGKVTAPVPAGRAGLPATARAPRR